MSYFTTPQRRMYCERLVDGRWTAVRDNGEIAYRDEELDTFSCCCIEDIYNIGTVWASCRADILGDELRSLLQDTRVTTLRYSDLVLFIDKSREGMYGAVTLEAIRNIQRGQDDYLSREEFERALDGYAQLKIIQHDVLEILGDKPEYIDYADIRIIWAEETVE